METQKDKSWSLIYKDKLAYLISEMGIYIVLVSIISTSILIHHGEDEVSASLVLILAVGLLFANLVSSFLFKDAKKRNEFKSDATLAIWLLTTIFVLPINSPFHLIDFLYIYIFIKSRSKTAMWIGTLLLVAANEIAILLHIDANGTTDVINPILYSTLLVAFAVFSSFVNLADSQEKDELRSEVEHAQLERQRLTSLINSMADGVIATNQEEKVILYNGAALDVLNVNASLEAQNISKFLPLVDDTGKKVDVFKIAKKANTFFVSRDFRLKISDDEFINLYISISPVRIGYGKGGDQGYILILRDITKEKSLEEERDEFISVVSHELRTPITIAEGNVSNAQLILEGDKFDKKVFADTLEQAHKQVVFLADMINDLSTLSRAERGKLQVEPESIDVDKLVDTLQEDYKVDAEHKGLKLEISKEKNLKPVMSSRLYVKEILQNFITNSIKYTEKGSITISAKNADGGTEFSVKDTGIGISVADQKKLFEKFFRSEDYRTRQNNGTGLGLYVTLKLARLIKAKIDVESEINKGSNFIIFVPNLEQHEHRKREDKSES